MNAPEMMFVMLIARLVVPFGLILLIGEGARRRQLVHFNQM